MAGNLQIPLIITTYMNHHDDSITFYNNENVDGEKIVLRNVFEVLKRTVILSSYSRSLLLMTTATATATARPYKEV